MQASWQRSQELIQEAGIRKLRNTHVRIFGCGGVGSFAVEALVRSGLGHLSLVDYDVIAISNLNRQLMSDVHNIGQLKVEVLKQRALSINPELIIDIHSVRYGDDVTMDFQGVDFVIDAMDDVRAKLQLMKVCQQAQIPLIMALGTARRLDPSQLYFSDLMSIEGDPLAKKLKAMVRKEGLKSVEVICSRETPLPTRRNEELNQVVLGSMIFVPATAGLWLAQRIVQQVLQDRV
jgi:tRNA threonylcarbamoyladenosine dehydratase